MSKDIYKEIATHYEQYDTPYRLDPFKKIHWGIVKKWKETPDVIFHHAENKDKFQYGAILKPVKSHRKLRDFSTLPVETMHEGETECLMFAYSDDQYIDPLINVLQSDKGLWLTRIKHYPQLNRRDFSFENHHMHSSPS